MAYFSNGSEGWHYQERYCFRCVYWSYADPVSARIGSSVGCPIWLLHELHVGNKDWQPVLDKLIPMDGIFAGECDTFIDRDQA